MFGKGTADDRAGWFVSAESVFDWSFLVYSTAVIVFFCCCCCFCSQRRSSGCLRLGLTSASKRWLNVRRCNAAGSTPNLCMLLLINATITVYFTLSLCPFISYVLIQSIEHSHFQLFFLLFFSEHIHSLPWDSTTLLDDPIRPGTHSVHPLAMRERAALQRNLVPNIQWSTTAVIRFLAKHK